jgi:5'-3' exonuclease
MMTPPFVNDDSALVILDWSWWLNKSFRNAGLDGMTPQVVGWLTALLSYNPAHVVIALDSPGRTFRHNMQHPSDPDWKYKDGRDVKPDDFYTLSAKLTAIAEEHSIPCLWADGFEADDVIATVTAKARAAGYRVYIITADKDLHQLVEADKRSGLLVGTWDNSTGELRGPAEVLKHYGVEPRQIADWLALAGDSGDSVPGVDGIGKDKAADILGMFGTLDDALKMAPWTDERFADVDRTIDDLAKTIKGVTPKRPRGAPKLAPVIPANVEDLKEQRARWKATRVIARDHRVLVANESIARFSRDLTALDCGAPLDVPWDDIPVGGFNVPALRKRYLDLGYTEKAKQVPSFPKRAPWGYP